MNKKSMKWKRNFIYMFSIVYCALAYSGTAHALSSSVYVTGTKSLLKDALTAAQAILAIFALVMWLVWEIQKRCNDENEETRYSKRQKGLIIGTIIGESILTLFNVIGSYYGITFSTK